jgi:hypothetical protein
MISKKRVLRSIRFSNWRIRKQVIEIFNKVEVLFTNRHEEQLVPVRVRVNRKIK